MANKQTRANIASTMLYISRGNKTVAKALLTGVTTAGVCLNWAIAGYIKKKGYGKIAMIFKAATVLSAGVNAIDNMLINREIDKQAAAKKAKEAVAEAVVEAAVEAQLNEIKESVMDDVIVVNLNPNAPTVTVEPEPTTATGDASPVPQGDIKDAEVNSDQSGEVTATAETDEGKPTARSTKRHSNK